MHDLQTSPSSLSVEDPAIAFSVVIPVLNEEENIDPLVEELKDISDQLESCEIIFVDDGSTDATFNRLMQWQPQFPDGSFRILRHPYRAGQSAALVSGVRHACGDWIIMLDGDGQNAPMDIPRLLAVAKIKGISKPCLIAGQRLERKDSTIKRWSSSWANRIRRAILHDDVADTGCSLKIISRKLFLELPYFDHMHRYLPALVLRAGGEIMTVPVTHRPRLAGQSKYGFFGRLGEGIVDLTGVWWLMRRANIPTEKVKEN